MDIRSFMYKKRRLEPKRDSSVPDSCESDNDKITETGSSTNAPEIRNLNLPVRDEPIKQIVLKEFPRKKNRSFRAAWYKQFEWLEYSVEKDAAFCYACRHFNRYGTKEAAYTEHGFGNWKNALDSSRGFPKHEKSEAHIQAMAMWKEKQIRVNSCTSVSTLISENVLEKHRYYVKSIVEVIQFLAANDLALRGDYIIEEHAERGLFVKLFEYTLKKDKTLSECAAIIPKNATYLSPEIQNEIIRIMAEVVRRNVADEINNADIPWFTLLEDGTRDKNNRENIAIALRYIKDGQIKESLLDIITTKELDAETFTEATFKTLDDNGIDKSKLLSQCFDGASVMSGKKGGVAALIQKKLNRNIPYVHCFNHRLHLVLIRTISETNIVKHFFEQCIMLHNFFHNSKVAALYEGKTIVRLLEQRWSGHFKITNVIFSNYSEIVKVLNAIPEDKRFDGEDVAKSKGIKSVMLSSEFRFCLVTCKKILGLLHPADAILQDPKSGLKDGIKVIKSVMNEISSMRNEDEYGILITQAEQLMPELEKNEYRMKMTEKGKRQVKSIKLKDFIITDKIPSAANSLSENKNSPRISDLFKSEFYEIIDVIISELNKRFHENEELIVTLSSVEEFEVSKMKCLAKLGINIPSIEELTVVKRFLLNHTDSEDERSKLDILFKYKEAFKDTYELLATVDTFGCSTATCESAFSTLTAINRPQRLSMIHKRMADLVFLAFEKKRTENVNLDEILHKLNSTKNRKLQLY